MIIAAKTGMITLGAGVAFVWSQLEWPDLGALGSFGLAAALAGLVARYTLSQLEGYRTDLGAARARIDTLVLDLHAQGQAKAVSEARIRELELYAHRLRVWIVAQSLDTRDMPEAPG